MKKRVIGFLLILLSVACFAQEEPKTHRQYGAIYTESHVDTLPSYPGGDAGLWQLFMEEFRVNSVMLPEAGEGVNILAVTMVIDTLGRIHDLAFIESFHPMVEREIERIIGLMPPWNPGFLSGNPIPVRIYFPIKYQLHGREFHILTSGTEMIVGRQKENKWLKWALGGGAVLLFYLLISGAI